MNYTSLEVGYLPGPLPLGVDVVLVLSPAAVADELCFTGEFCCAVPVVFCCCLVVLPTCALGGCACSGGPNV